MRKKWRRRKIIILAQLKFFEQIKTPHPSPLPHTGIYITNLSGRGVKGM